jgi:hypothetical protein
MKSFTKNGVTKTRRLKVIKRLEKQLIVGVKPAKDIGVIELTEKDKQRINKELETLKTRV